jgi:transcriptional regulator with XRE-family HTH domain
VDVPDLIVTARHASGLSLRELAGRAGTSHSTLSAYETGRVAPSVATLERVLDAAGLAIEIDTVRRVRRTEHLERGVELWMALELAASFPAPARPTSLRAPRFGRSG